MNTSRSQPSEGFLNSNKPHIRLRIRFSLIEILIVTVIFAILATILLPALRDARIRAKFTRWLAFNKMLSNDPACVVNFNFQEGTGTTLTNTCFGSDATVRYDSAMYNGILKTTDNNPHFQWVTSGGRFGRFKKALQFNGSHCYVEIPGTEALDFTPKDSFTVVVWVKFDRVDAYNCIFAKCEWYNIAQYDVYSQKSTILSDGSQGSAIQYDLFTICRGWEDDVGTKDVSLASRWRCIALVYDGMAGGYTCVYVDGEGKKISSSIYSGNQNATGTHTTTTFILGGARMESGGISYMFNGRIDEFQIFKRAMSQAEIRGIYAMGREGN